MVWHASVLSTTSSDTEPTVVIAFDSAKYIFNVGENTTRAFLQSRQNWKKTRALFLTSVGTQRASGLPGFFMTLADAGQSQIQVTGPSGLLHFIASMRKYTYRDNLVVTPTEVSFVRPCTKTDELPVYKDENVSIYALPVVPCEPPSQIKSQRDDATSPLKRKREDSPKRSSKRHSSQHGASSGDIMSMTEHLRKAAYAPDFDPTLLTGEMAQAWRLLLIQCMFPASRASSAPEGSTSGKSKETHKAKNGNGNTKVDPGPSSNSAQGFSLPKFNKSLAMPEHALVGSPDLAFKPVVAYAIVGPRIRGKFDGKKAAELGLPSGPLRAKLVRGENVTVQVKDGDGNVVHREIKPQDCIGESVTPGVVLLLDAPSLAHVPALLSSFAESRHFSKYLWKHAKESKEHQVRGIFHLCGDGVLEDQRYKTFMSEFGPEVHHMVASRKHLSNPMTFTSAAYSQLRLHQLDPNIFPMQTYSCTADQTISDVPGLPARLTVMQKNTLIKLHPPHPPVVDVEAGKDDLFHPAASSSSPLILPESTRNSFADAQSLVARTEPEDVCGGDVSICPLGTNSAMPSKYRNVSSTLVHAPRYGYVLLDAGEGTYGQLARKFGDDPTAASSVWHVLRQLKCIFISHMHADHHIGLAKLLAMRQRLDPPPCEPLYVVGHDHVFLYLGEYAGLETLGLAPHTPSPVVPVSIEAIHWKNCFGSPQRDAYRSSVLAHDAMCASLGLESFRSVDVVHRTSCHGAILKHTDGWSIVYSGDTVPTDNLVQAGEHATLLIHEATMADDQTEMAAAKMHSTVGQAIDVGRRMKARNVLLTHFSARYPNVPPSVATERRAGDPTIALAFDHAHIRIGDMHKMNAYVGAIEQSFSDLEDDPEAETRTVEVDIP